MLEIAGVLELFQMSWIWEIKSSILYRPLINMAGAHADKYIKQTDVER